MEEAQRKSIRNCEIHNAHWRSIPDGWKLHPEVFLWTISVRQKRNQTDHYDAGIQTMQDRRNKHIMNGAFEPNPGLDGSLQTFTGIVKAPVNDNGYCLSLV